MLQPSNHLVAHEQFFPSRFVIRSNCHDRQEGNFQWSEGVRAGHRRDGDNHDINLVTHYDLRSGENISSR